MNGALIHFCGNIGAPARRQRRRSAARKHEVVSSYHFSVQVISRSTGRSVVAAAAYRAGQKLNDRRLSRTADFSRRRGVVHAEILAPAGSAAWLQDRETLWNAVERMERRRDAQLAREINLALPHELSAADRLALVRSFVREQFVSRGMVADVAIHQPVVEKGEDPRNYHAHILLTLRQATPQGLRDVKTREWNSDSLLRHWRACWAAEQNRLLRNVGQSVDHRSLAAQRAAAVAQRNILAVIELDRLPELHLGARATAVMRKLNTRAGPGGRGPATAQRPRPSDRGTPSSPLLFRSSGRAAVNFERHSINTGRWSRAITRLQSRASRARQLHHQRQRKVATMPSPRFVRSQEALRRMIHQLEMLIRVLIRRRDVRLARRNAFHPLLRGLRAGRSRSRNRSTLAQALPPR